jgi:hypothetical protein
LLNGVPLIKTFFVTTSVAGALPGGMEADKSGIV